MVVARVQVAIIEDDEGLRGSLERLLNAGGFASIAYACAEAALAGLIATQVACVVSDLRLPGMSGLDLLAALRARGNHMPFILITAHDAPGQPEEAARRGATAYLAKPFRGTELLERIRAVLEPAESP